MRDLSTKCLVAKETIYRDVAVIGNGPSGIALSFMLSGHWPYWNAADVESHPDELLRARLNYADNGRSLVEQDLATLADGLEGRSTNPVSLLLDSLTHPCADLGMELPSMLHYRFHPEKKIDHIVIGKGRAGGSWHRMDPNLRTLSLSAWMSLPGLDFNVWEAKNPPKSPLEAQKEENGVCLHCQKIDVENNNFVEESSLCQQCTKRRKPSSPIRKASIRQNHSKEVETRALISRVAEYYESYVKEMDLERYFMNDATVTSIAPFRCPPAGREACGKAKDARWIVSGIRKNKAFTILCRNVVLANGSSDLANRLGIRGERLSIPWLKHELPHLEAALEAFKPSERRSLKPVLIVGAGLSAADAITICRQSGVHVIHVFRSRTAGLDKMLPENVYPEYHEVHRMMKSPHEAHSCYSPLPEHTIADVVSIPSSTGEERRRVTVRHIKTGETRDFEVSFCAILIGARPDLRFLAPLSSAGAPVEEPTEPIEDSLSFFGRQLAWLKNLCAKCRHMNFCERVRRPDYKKICGHNVEKRGCECAPRAVRTAAEDVVLSLGLGEDPHAPVDGKSNPIAVDKYTNRVLRGPAGLFAMGPLVGDNFVRFIPGGALAITSALQNLEND
ncbi:oxidative stress-induced growth inhibitor 1-like [Phlebotomus argentipes]|uniref:oxidative stress-induced growth inhibitor 1-like n=1 Tax=Phlebotomus argentipes TaxID=94469 RepID=UPI00289347F7|nr:oxidative stress-induced growth inhibitor 1-like [Phlebotomus argentipes]